MAASAAILIIFGMVIIVVVCRVVSFVREPARIDISVSRERG